MTQPGGKGFWLAQIRSQIDHLVLTGLLQNNSRKALAADTRQQPATGLEMRLGQLAARRFKGRAEPLALQAHFSSHCHQYVLIGNPPPICVVRRLQAAQHLKTTTGAQRQPVSAQLRDYVMPHDVRIAQYTGQPFGEAYFEGLLRDTTAVFDSAPPTTAVLAADQLAGRGLYGP